jgi:hypothetical protein
MTNFATPVNGATPSEDYLSIFTKNYDNSPYNVTLVLTATLQDSVMI